MSEEDVNKFFAGLDPQTTPATTAAPSTNQLQASDTGAGAPMPSPAPATQAEPEPAPADAPPQFVPLEIPQAKVPELTQEQIKPVDYSQRDQAFQQHLEALRHPLAKLPDAPIAPVEKPKQSQNLIEMMSKPIGSFAKGILAGDIDIADQIHALAQAPSKMGPGESKPQEDYGQQFEKNFGKDDVGTPAYNAGKLLGSMGTYGAGAATVGTAAAAAGIPAAAGALGLAASGVEGGILGAGQNAREQLRHTGRVSDSKGLAGDVALGGALGLGGGMLGNAAMTLGGAAVRKGGKFLAKKSLDAALKKAQQVADKSGEVIADTENMLKAGIEQTNETLEELKHEVLKHEIEAVDKLAEMFGQRPPAENAYQVVQREALETGTHSRGGGGKPQAATKPVTQRFNFGASGRFAQVTYPSQTEADLVRFVSRIRRAETGKNPTPFPEQAEMRNALAKQLGVDPGEVHKIAAEYAKAVKAGAEAASHVDELFTAPPAIPPKVPFRLRKRSIGYQTIEHAQPLDAVAQHMSAELFERFEEAVKTMGEAKAVVSHFKNEVEQTAMNGLALAKTKAQKAFIEVTETERLKSGAAAELAKEKTRLYVKQRMEEISKMDAALQAQHMPHNILDEIPMSKQLYGIADRTGFFKTARHLADNFSDAYKEFVEATHSLKAAQKQYEKLSEHYLPVFEQAEAAYQGSIGTDQERLWVKTRITNPFSVSKDAPLVTDAKMLAGRAVHEDKNFPLSNQRFNEGGGQTWTPKELTDDQVQQAIDVINYHKKNKSTKHGDLKKLDALVQEKMRREQRKAGGYPRDWKQAEAAKFEGLTDEDLSYIMDTGSEAQANEAALEMLRRANPDEDVSQYNVRHTDFAIGLQHKPYVAKLNAQYAKELKLFDEELRAQEENVVAEIAYKIGGVEKLAKMSGGDAMNKLREMGVLHPVAEKLALAAAFGITALDAPAQASDGSTPTDDKHFFGKLGLTAIAAVIAGKYGVPIAQRVIRMPSFYYARCFANTRDHAGFADAAMGISALTNKGASMAYQMGALAGKVIQAVVDAPDDHIYLLKAVHGDVDTKLLSPAGKKLVKEIRDESKAFQEFISGYAREWRKVYAAMPKHQQEQLADTNQAIDFLHSNFGKNARVRNWLDKAAGHLFTNAVRAWFTYNPKIWGGGFADMAITGTMTVGPFAMARASKTLAGNPVIRGLIDKMELGGARSQVLNALNQTGTALGMEARQSQLMAVASLSHYFHSNPRTMRAIGVADEESFIKKVLTGQIDSDVRADAFIQMSADLADSIGADPLRLTRGPIGRSMLGNFLQFTSAPERLLRNMMLRAKTNPKWVVAGLGAMHQFAGSAVLPLSAKIAGYAFAGEATAKVISLLDMASAGQRLGLISNKMLEWDPFLTPFMGVMSPGFESATEILNDWPGTAAAIGEVMYQASQGGQGLARMTGNPQNDANQKAQYALYSLLQKIALAEPMMGPVPTRALANFAYHMPAAMAGVARVSVPNPIHLGKGKPLKPTEIKRFDGAAEQSVRAALGLPDSFKVGLFKTSQSVPKSERSEVLRDLKRESGIF